MAQEDTSQWLLREALRSDRMTMVLTIVALLRMGGRGVGSACATHRR